MSQGRASKQSAKKNRYKYKLGETSGEVLKNINDDNPVIKMFKEYGTALDSKHDRYERQVKVGRDIVIESKRIIFLLHTTATDIPEKREQILDEADTRLKNLAKKYFRTICLDLENVDPYQYHKAYIGALEEFVEAVMFYNFIKDGTIQTYDNIKRIYFEFEEPDSTLSESGTRIVHLCFPMINYILGLADFTGELMRKSINSLSSGQLDDCFKTCAIVRSIHIGFMGVSSMGFRTVSRKFYTLSQSVTKMENVCYTLRVRGNEVPRRVLMAVIDETDKTGGDADDDVDEGIF